MAIGLHRVLSLPVTLPLPQLVEALNQFQPTYLHVYPSVAMWLADEQQAGRLQLTPQILVTAAELRTPEMTQRLTNAFGVRPFDALRLHRGALRLRVRAPPGHPPLRRHHPRRERRRRRPTGAGWTARRPAAGHQPVQPGPAAAPARGHRPGHPRPRPLPLRAHTGPRQQPSMAAAMTSSRFPPATAAGSAVHPLQFALLTRDPQVREFQVVQDGPALRILIVPRSTAAATAGDDNWRPGSARPSPDHSSGSAYRTRRSPSSAATSSPAPPAASSSS